uniref:NADPH--cytochrome P450 reductase n=1 Tax=Hydra vulgaris TaxID=6087 RepID=T2MGU1_HYDVU
MEVTDVYGLGFIDSLLLISFLSLIFYYAFRRKEKVNGAFKLKDFPELKKLKTSSPNDVVNETSNGFVSKMMKSEKTIAIFYGSQTGTAEEFANRISKDSHRYGLKAAVFDPEEFDMSDLINLKEIPKSLAVFLLATYGEGDPTDNALPLKEWLQEDHDLNGLNFTVFSLGNKTYEHYQFFGRYVDKRLEELGGNRVVDRGEGDDDSNIEEDFLIWRDKFWESVCNFYGCKNIGLSQTASRDFKLEAFPMPFVGQIFKGEITKLGALDKQQPPFDIKNPYMAKVVVNRELHKGGNRSCMHIEFDINQSGIRYEAGDHVAVYPTNDTELVEKLGDLLGVNLDDIFSLNNIDLEASKKHPFPCPTSIRNALLYYVDITSIVKLHVLQEFIQYTTAETDLAILKKLCDSSPDGKHFYNEWIVNSYRNIISVLEDLPSCKPPFDLVLEMLPRLQCRYYSISSSPKLSKNRIHITAVVVDWITPTGRRQKGVATNWLKSISPELNLKVPLFVRQTTFRLPSKCRTPIMMVGPGTGLAPFRGFIQERQMMLESGMSLGLAFLYFGCRKESEDYIYAEELSSYVQSGAITKLSVAFSRDQAEKVYVTHKIKENLGSVWQLIKDGGHIYVCGDAKIAKEMQNLIIEAIIQGGKSNELAKSLMHNLSNTGRYSVDVW